MTYRLITDTPVAVDSLDHTHPWGTYGSNTSEIFVAKLLSLRTVRNALDIGCAAGDFVKTLADHGVDSVGIEGSDRNKQSGHGEWTNIPDRLFTCDASKRFWIYQGDASEPVCFDLVTAWEVFEHIELADLNMFLDNINDHSGLGSWLICSISNDSFISDGAELHRNRQSRDWWLDTFASKGWANRSDLYQEFDGDGSRENWVQKNELGFNLVLERVS